MAYIGRDTDKISNVEVLDNITFDGSSSYTLQKGGSNFTPSSANTLLVSINGVVQAGNFTVSGSTIDFGTAVAGTSTCDFILHYGVGLITTPSDGTVTTAKLADSSVSLAKLTATGTKDATTFLRGDNTFASAGGTNTPAFFATMSADQTGIADNTFTKVQFNSERFDTDSAYDPTTNYRFTVPTGKGGKYFLSTTLLFTSSSFLYFTDLVFYINGTAADKFVTTGNDAVNNVKNIGITLNSILSLNATDYVEVFVKIDTSSAGTFDANQNTTASPRCFWYGYKIIE
jgi:hypothetical protein